MTKFFYAAFSKMWIILIFLVEHEPIRGEQPRTEYASVKYNVWARATSLL